MRADPRRQTRGGIPSSLLSLGLLPSLPRAPFLFPYGNLGYIGEKKRSNKGFTFFLQIQEEEGETTYARFTGDQATAEQQRRRMSPSFPRSTAAKAGEEEVSEAFATSPCGSGARPRRSRGSPAPPPSWSWAAAAGSPSAAAAAAACSRPPRPPSGPSSSPPSPLGCQVRK